MLPNFLGKSVLPRKPGVYLFKNTKGRIIYIGKAMDLYQRVASYFSNPLLPWISSIASVETIIVQSELEALILEANLIKKYLPLFNVRLTDDRDYLYIGITKEAFPKIITLRKQDLKKVKKFWGPFPSSKTVRVTLKSLRKVFPWCSDGKRACFYYHLNLCPGPCVRMISKEDYAKIIKRFAKLLEGKKEELVEELTKEMKEYAKEQKYEQAAKIKDVLDGIFYLTQSNRVKLYLENPNFLEQETKLALKQLQQELNLKKLPERIEGYDVSNIQGKEATGSMVVLTNGELDKSQYRKFKIQISGKPNDVGMHKEMINRRLKHLEWPLPDLIIVDGGRGQARAMDYGIAVFGLAKRLEWLYPPEGVVIKLKRSSPSLKLLQKLRDEAHRFAISYHRKLRDRIEIV